MLDDQDPRLQPGAYIAHPPNLYEVVEHDDRNVVLLRNCRTEYTLTHSPSFIVHWFKLIKPAPVAPNFVGDQPQPEKEAA